MEQRPVEGGPSGDARLATPRSAGELQAKARFLRGLFSGGTLASEALLGLAAVLGPVYSNLAKSGASEGAAPLSPTRPLPELAHSPGHTVLDLGADELTVGRLHPMIDFDLRLRRLRQEAADPEVALVLLDVVLGDGAHPDPAAELAPAVERARAEARAAGRELAVAAVVIGTDEDPQDLGRQVAALEDAGARVFLTVGELVEHAVRCLPEPERRASPGPQPPPVPEPPEPRAPASREAPAREASRPTDRPERSGTPVPLAVLEAPLAAVNVGLASFYDSLRAQGAAAVQVDWRPPAGGDEKLAGILARLKGR